MPIERGRRDRRWDANFPLDDLTPALVPVGKLRERAGVELGRLGEIVLDPLAPIAKRQFGKVEYRAVHHEIGHASQNVTQDYIHTDEALKLAVQGTSDEIERLLALGVPAVRPPR